MKKILPVLLTIAALSSCRDAIQEKSGTMLPPAPAVQSQPDTTPRVTGIGGIFFKTKDPAQTRSWYGKNLGLAIDDYGSPFEFRNANNPDQVNYLRWSPVKEATGYFAPSKNEFMINYRVQYLEKLVEQLRRNGVAILDTIETYDYGKFVHIMDADGNKIELWEPVDSVLTKLGSKTTR